MDGVDVGVQPLAPRRCCSVTLHPQQGTACLHPGFWVFGSHLPSEGAIVPLYGSASTRCHPLCCSSVSGTPQCPWGGNDLALYWCSSPFLRRGGGFAA